MPYSWQDDPTGRNAIEKAEGNTVFPGLLSSNASVNLADTQIDLEASIKLPDAQVALDVALEDDRQAILACARPMGGCTRAITASEEDERLWPAASALAYPPAHGAQERNESEAKIQEAHLAHVLAPPS